MYEIFCHDLVWFEKLVPISKIKNNLYNIYNTRFKTYFDIQLNNKIFYHNFENIYLSNKTC